MYIFHFLPSSLKKKNKTKNCSWFGWKKPPEINNRTQTLAELTAKGQAATGKSKPPNPGVHWGAWHRLRPPVLPIWAAVGHQPPLPLPLLYLISGAHQLPDVHTIQQIPCLGPASRNRPIFSDFASFSCPLPSDVVHRASGVQFCAERAMLASEGRGCHVQAKQAEEEEIIGEVADALSPPVVY